MKPIFILLLLAVTALPAEAGQQPLRHRSGLGDYLSQSGKRYEVWGPSSSKHREDDAQKLFEDMNMAVEAYEYLKRKRVRYEDKQNFVSFEFYKDKIGAAKFNPNAGQTGALQARLNDLFSAGKVTQADLLYEALAAADGNMTLALGSLAELFCWNRQEYISKVADMTDSQGKNYYRYAGAFIGLHSGVVRTLGQAGSYINIGGNPLAYAGMEVFEWWNAFLRSNPTKDVDTMKTLGPQGNGNLIDKGSELHKGRDAAAKLVEAKGICL